VPSTVEINQIQHVKNDFKQTNYIYVRIKTNIEICTGTIIIVFEKWFTSYFSCRSKLHTSLWQLLTIHQLDVSMVYKLDSVLGRDSVVVGLPDSLSSGNWFDCQQYSTNLGLSKPAILLVGVATLVSALAGGQNSVVQVQER